jgi:DNA-binding transcriptional LysR family regulator
MSGHLESLQAFVEVAEKQSFSAAGRALNQSAPAMTRLVAELETSLGVQLLVRTTRSVSLTLAGTHYLAAVKPLLANLARADENARDEQHGLRGKLRINAPMSFGQAFLPKVISRFRILHHAIDVELTLDDAFIDITTGGFDMALRISAPPRDKSTIWRKICLIPRVLVASPQYLERRGTPATAHDLADHNCLAYAGASETPLWRLSNGSEAKVSRFCFICNNGDVLADLATLDEGVTLLPVFIVAKHLATGRLRTVLNAWTAPDIWLTAYYPPYVQLPAKVKAFTAFIEDVIALDLPAT